MSISQVMRRLGVDPFLVLLVLTLSLAALLPASGPSAEWVSRASYFAVVVLFFVYGAKLDPRAVLAGLANWRLQGGTLLITFVAFPLLGLGLASALSIALPRELTTGMLFLAILPSTVQSCIAFTSLAGGNVGGAVCAATISNMAAVALTPLLAALLLHTGAVSGGATVANIALQILLPFAMGQLARRVIGIWLSRHPRFTVLVDRGSILLIVYAAFSAGVISGVWHRVGATDILLLLAGQSLLLLSVAGVAAVVAKGLGLDYLDRTAMQFCGSTKSLATGIPIANILFAGQAISLIVLPLMIFHQLQIFVCSLAAQHLSRKATGPAQNSEVQ